MPMFERKFVEEQAYHDMVDNIIKDFKEEKINAQEMLDQTNRHIQQLEETIQENKAHFLRNMKEKFPEIIAGTSNEELLDQYVLNMGMDYAHVKEEWELTTSMMKEALLARMNPIMPVVPMDSLYHRREELWDIKKKYEEAKSTPEHPDNHILQRTKEELIRLDAFINWTNTKKETPTPVPEPEVPILSLYRRKSDLDKQIGELRKQEQFLLETDHLRKLQDKLEERIDLAKYIEWVEQKGGNQ